MERTAIREVRWGAELKESDVACSALVETANARVEAIEASILQIVSLFAERISKVSDSVLTTSEA